MTRMHERPLISVVMAAKNASRYLRDALDSVMAQTYTHYEIVLVDGQSTDDTVAIAQSYPATRVIPQRRTGFADAWNDGIADARGSLIAILDSDDRWTPGKLASQVAVLEADADVAAVIGRVTFFMAPGQQRPPGFRLDLLEGDHIAHMPGALLARRSVFDVVGPFTPDWAIASDIDWFARLKDSGLTVVAVPDVVIHKRVHDSNLSYTAARTPVIGTEVVKLLRASILRQRGQS